MTKWEYKIVISDITRNYNDDESNVNSIGKAVAERIRQSDAYKRYRHTLGEIAKKMEEVTTEAQFNRVLDEFYDFGDAHRIWIENFPEDSPFSLR